MCVNFWDKLIIELKFFDFFTFKFKKTRIERHSLNFGAPTNRASTVHFLEKLFIRRKNKFNLKQRVP